MLLGVVNETVDEHFTVVDCDNNKITGIDSTEFTVYVYNSAGTDVTSLVSGFFTELGNGNYKYTFTPNSQGTWYVDLTHPVYFPWGKNDDPHIYNADLSDIYISVSKTLGLAKHNIYIDQPIYDEAGNLVSARVRTYTDSASVGTNSNVLETYRIESDGTECGQFSYWEQKEI